MLKMKTPHQLTRRLKNSIYAESYLITNLYFIQTDFGK